MPWTTKDADKFKKGLSDSQKEKWAKIANSVLKRCIEKGGTDELDCEVKAIRIANAKAIKNEDDDGGEETDVGLMNTITRLSEIAGDSPIELDEVVPVAEDSEWQRVLPVGLFHNALYGELIFTKRFMERIVENYKGKRLFAREPFIDTNHDFGAANGWIKDERATDEGLEVKIKWTPRGKKLLEDEEYRYFSSTVMSHIDTMSGEKIFPSLPAVTLTNIPAMNMLDPAHLEERHNKEGEERDHGIAFSSKSGNNDNTDATYNDGTDIKKRKTYMKYEEIITAIPSLSATEQAGLATVLGYGELQTKLSALTEDLKASGDKITALEGEKETLSKANETMSAQLEEIRKEVHGKNKLAVIGTALSEGKILPKDESFWNEKYDENPAYTESVLAHMGKAVSFTAEGTSRTETADDPAETEETKEVIANLKAQGWTDEDIKSYVK